LQSAHQKYSEVAQPIELGEAWFLSWEVGAELSKQILDDQNVQLSIEQTEQEIAELTHELEMGDRDLGRRTLRNRRDGGQRVTRLGELTAVFSERAVVPTARQHDLEQELANLTAENEQLLARKLELEGKRPPSAEDELRLFRLHVGASRSVAERAGERMNGILKKQIADTDEAIHRLQRRLALSDLFGMAVDRRRSKVLCEGVNPRSAIRMMNLTIDRLEGLVAQRRQCATAVRK
jgi:HPt (histidine-containing phosphotransfer) domain-containing protein